MNRTERFYKIDQMLHERRVVPLAVFLEELEVSRATFKRDMEYMRERLNAPIVWDRQAGGYRFESVKTTGPAYELPGLWFSSGELYALLAAQKLLTDIEPGILVSHVAPLQARLAALLDASGHPAAEINRRVRLLSMAKRKVEPRFFADITLALLERKRIEIDAGTALATRSIPASSRRSSWCITATTGISMPTAIGVRRCGILRWIRYAASRRCHSGRGTSPTKPSMPTTPAPMGFSRAVPKGGRCCASRPNGRAG